MTLEGVQLAIKGVAEEVLAKSFVPVKEMLDSFITNGDQIGVCPSCAKTRGVTDEDMLALAGLLGAVVLLEQTKGRQIFAF